MATIGSKLVYFNDGEAILHTDMNAMTDLLATRIIDWLLYGTLTNIDFPNPDTAAQVWSNTGIADDVVFVFGNGCILDPVGGMTIQLHPGILADVSANANPLALTASNIRLVGIDTAISYVVPANASGSTRYDCISVGFTGPTASDSESRHFKDGVTGALSSQAMNKRNGFGATFTYTQGTPGVTTRVALPSGHKVIADVMVPNGAAAMDHTNIRCQMFPVGRAWFEHLTPLRDAYYNVAAPEWTASQNGYISSDLTSACSAVLFTRTGHGLARVVGVRFAGRVYGTDALTICETSSAADGTVGFPISANAITATRVITPVTPAVIEHQVTDMSSPSVHTDLLKPPVWGTGLTNRTRTRMLTNRPHSSVGLHLRRNHTTASQFTTVLGASFMFVGP